MKTENVVFIQNPEIDILFGFYGGSPIPTKQDDYKPIPNQLILEYGEIRILEGLYQKKPEKKSIQEFNQKISTILSENVKYKKFEHPKTLEVIISVLINETRFFEVDVDNLSKTILDSLKGIMYDDDSQVVSLICKKHIHPMTGNGLFIGITETNKNKLGISDKFCLFFERKEP